MSQPMSGSAAATDYPWYRKLEATQWKNLLASNHGWVFDGFEVYSLILTVGVALRQLLNASEHQRIPAYAGTIIATPRSARPWGAWPPESLPTTSGASVR
jgi:hypothetical protein